MAFQESNKDIVNRTMAIPKCEVIVGREYCFSGVLHTQADGYGRTGRRFDNYRVHVVMILDRDVPYPILLGDEYSDQLGWVSRYDLNYN